MSWMLRRLVLTFCCLGALVAPISGAVASASEPRPGPDACTWGASSLTAELVNGVWVQSQPEVTGCAPTP